MRIAVVDDERSATEHLCCILKTCAMASTVQVFCDVNRLFDAIEDHAEFDVILMDIEWHRDKNGIDFASMLLDCCPTAQIIYVTGYNDRFSQKIFLKPSNLCGFLVKPVAPDLLNAMLEKAQEQIDRQDNQKLLIQQKGTAHAIPYRDICYLESRGHQLIIHTFNDSILHYQRLEELKKQLPAQFFQCHKSYLVNMSLIRRIEKNAVFLKTGEEVPVSKSRYQETRTAYFRYMGEVL